MKVALNDGLLEMKELTGGKFARALRFVGFNVGANVLTAMNKDTLLQTGKVDPNDYRVFVHLLRRADLPEGAGEHIKLAKGVREQLQKRVDGFRNEMLEGSKTAAFIEKVDGKHVVNQTAMTLAPVSTDEFFKKLPPEFWAEDCFDLKSIHTEVLDRQETAAGGYKMTMIQRMEFGDAPMATDMCKRTEIELKKNDEGKLVGTARWLVYALNATDQIPHDGSMLIDQGRMEWRPVEHEGKDCTEIIFNNQTQTNTQLEKKLMDWIAKKDSPVRGRVSAELAASELMGIHEFAGGVVTRYRDLGMGEVAPRWPDLKLTHVVDAT